jgi:hypothetical protein
VGRWDVPSLAVMRKLYAHRHGAVTLLIIAQNPYFEGSHLGIVFNDVFMTFTPANVAILCLNMQKKIASHCRKP